MVLLFLKYGGNNILDLWSSHLLLWGLSLTTFLNLQKLSISFTLLGYYLMLLTFIEVR